MQYRYLGRSGLLVSRVCLGTMTFGNEQWGCDYEAAEAITNRFIEAGGNFIDTADLYSSGVSEEMVGKAIKQRGKVRYIGCSNLYAWQIVKATSMSEKFGYERFVSAQHLYNLIRRDVEREILPACDSEGLGMICWSPLAAGMLTGKYRGMDKPSAESRFGHQAKIYLPRYWFENAFALVEKVVETAEGLGKTPAQVALAWLLGDHRVTAVIVGARSENQIRDNIEVGDWDLPQMNRVQLTETSHFDFGYPKEWMDSTFEGTFGREEFVPSHAVRLP